MTRNDFWIGMFLLFSQLWLMYGLIVGRDEKRMALGVALGSLWLGVLVATGAVAS